MANDFRTPSAIANEAIMQLENELVLGNKVHTDYSKEFTYVGNSVDIRKPTQYLGQDDNLDITGYREDIEQATHSVTMDKTVTIPIKIGALERTLDFDRWNEDVIQPAVIKMRDRIESALAAEYAKLYHFTGTPGTLPGTFKALGAGGSIMTDGGVPNAGRFAIHGTDAALELADGLKGVYVQSKAKSAFEEAMIGRYAKFDNYESVHAPTHVVGNYGGTPLVQGASQNVTYAASKDAGTQTLVTDGWPNSRTGLLKAGDVFTIAGVEAVNPVSKQSTGRLQTFVVRSDANSNGSGVSTLTIAPAIIVDGAYQTVTAAPADNAAITVVSGAANSSHKQSMLLHPKALTLVTRPLDIPNGQGLKTATKSGNRVTISVSEFVDGNTLDKTCRLDMLFGTDAIDPRLGLRLTN